MSEINTIHFHEWKNLKDYLTQFKDGWFYRGQSNSNWDLKTSLERTDFKWTDQKAELTLLGEFQRGAHNFLNTNDIPNTGIGWLAFMQHYGTPTRLLDFTLSPYVAVYFAVINSKTEAALWAINNSWLNKEIKNIVTDQSYYNQIDSLDFNYDGVFQEVLLSNNYNFVSKVSPHLKNERIYYQQGLHISPGNTKISFMENLRSMNNYSNNVIQITISNNARLEALKDLLKMNINRATLFPSIDGFAISVKEKLQINRATFKQ